MTAYTVFQGDTGNYLVTPIDTSISAASGYGLFVGRGVQYRIDGITTSGNLYISHSGIGTLVPGKYVVLPIVVDVNSKAYFLGAWDVEVEYVSPTYVQV